MKDLLSYNKLKLLYTRNKLILNDTFETITGWKVKGDWHVVTVDTNVDLASGLDGNLALNCAGSYSGGIMTKEINLKNYGEIIFEYYLENIKGKEEPNSLKFYIDDVIKLEVSGPSPWQRCIPIGITPGKHTLKYEYILKGEPNKKKAIVDTIMIYESAMVDCLIMEHSPAKPIKNINANKTIRGFTRFQEMTASDTEIAFTAGFDGIAFLEFMQKSDEAFYFVDEFGICYRGIFNENIEPKNIAINEVYFVELSMTAGQKTGIGFC